MNTKDFLRLVVTGPSDGGYFLLAFGNGIDWREEYYNYPEQIDIIVARATELSSKTNVYFSTYLFSEKRSLKKCILPTRTIQADLDHADILTLPLVPTVLVRTSEGRHQGYWVLKTDAETLEVHEILSRKLTYAIPLCDHSGWALGRKVRLPNTFNYKYITGPQLIEVSELSHRIYRESDFELLPDVSVIAAEQYDNNFIELTELPKFDLMPNQLLETVKTKLPSHVYAEYNVESDDRSKSLWALMCSLFRAGFDKDAVVYISWHSANNKFKGLLHHSLRELAKDVLRAEEVVRTNVKDIRELLTVARRQKGLPAGEKHQYMFSMVLADMRQRGSFIRTTDDFCWFVRHDLGRPIMITERSDYLQALLDIQYGLNSTETDHKYIVASLGSFGKEIPMTGQTVSLSYYSNELNALLLHGGRKDVLKISASGVEKVINGAYGLVFPWNYTTEQFNPIYSDTDWGEVVFGDAVNNVINFTPSDAKVLLKIWFLFLLFRSTASSRPILALYGQPGCISGSTVLDIEYSKRGSRRAHKCTIAALYATCESTNTNYAIRIMSLKDGVIASRAIHKIIDSGRKVTYTITIEGCKPFRTTLDHRFLTPSGYKLLLYLRRGDEVVVKGHNYGIATAFIQSVEYYGEESTFDIVMEDEDAPNFIVNGVICHNSGKSTLFRRIYMLLYGPNRSLDSVTKADNFDQAMVSDPLVVLDNVDTFTSWLPDRLAQGAGTTDIVKRKLWTDSDSVYLKRQAMLGVTAHNPKFGREDISDRLLLITLERLAKFKPEGEILEQVRRTRNHLWGSIILDIQRILATPQPSYEEIPQFRVEDFGRIGAWIAKALGIEEQFIGIIKNVGIEQRALNLGNDPLLVEALVRFVNAIAPGVPGTTQWTEWLGGTGIWGRIAFANSDPKAFEVTYKNALTLSRKLWSMQDSLRETMQIEFAVDKGTSARIWRFAKK